MDAFQQIRKGLLQRSVTTIVEGFPEAIPAESFVVQVADVGQPIRIEVQSSTGLSINELLFIGGVAKESNRT